MPTLPTYSATSICQDALREVPDRTIASLDDGSLQARECGAVYAQCVAEVLEEHPWDFAIARQALTPVPNDRLGEWASAFATPDDAAFIGKVFLPDTVSDADAPGVVAQPVPYLGLPILPSIASVGWTRDWDDRAPGWRFLPVDSVLYSDAPTGAVAEYTTNLLPESRFTPLFVRAVTMLIASRIAPALKKDRSLQRDLFTSYQFELGRAKSSDRNRTQTMYGDFTPDWIAVR